MFPDFKLDMDTQPIGVFSRLTASNNIKDNYFCKVCGSRVVHKTRTRDQVIGDSSKALVSVKAGCLDTLDWKDAIHIWCQNAVIPIPENVERYEGEPPEDD